MTRAASDAALLAVRRLGRVPWPEADALQERLVAQRRRGEIPDTLLLMEHPPVVTLGRGWHPENLLLSREEMERRGIAVHEAGRGGDVTYHGPGQLVGWPVVALRGNRRDAHRFLRDVEEALIRTTRHFGVETARIPGLTGTWAGDRKLAAIGVRLNAGWITSHGFALNVGTDLAGFEAIVPCGIEGKGVTSLERETGRSFTLDAVGEVAAARLAEVLGLRLSWAA